MTHTTFELHSTASNPRVAVATGEIDTTNASDFTAAVDSLPGPRPLVLDLSDLSYIDSAGFAELDHLLARQAIVVVIPLRSVLHKAAMLVGLPCHEAVATAAAALR